MWSLIGRSVGSLLLWEVLLARCCISSCIKMVPCFVDFGYGARGGLAFEMVH